MAATNQNIVDSKGVDLYPEFYATNKATGGALNLSNAVVYGNLLNANDTPLLTFRSDTGGVSITNALGGVFQYDATAARKAGLTASQVSKHYCWAVIGGIPLELSSGSYTLSPDRTTLVP